MVKAIDLELSKEDSVWQDLWQFLWDELRRMDRHDPGRIAEEAFQHEDKADNKMCPQLTKWSDKFFGRTSFHWQERNG